MKKIFLFSIIFLILSLASTAQKNNTTNTVCDPQDSIALVDLYNNTNGTNWNNNKNWLTKKPVKEWIGVQVKNGRVVGLNLGTDYNGHSGDNLVGTIPETIGQLSNLYYLNLHVNHINGNIPKAIAKLTNLTVLDLSTNQLSDSIPSSLGNLVNLKSVNLGENQLSGPIPATFGNLLNLKDLNLSYNQLSGIIPASLISLKISTITELHDNYFNFDGLEELKRDLQKAGKDEMWYNVRNLGKVKHILHINQRGNRLYVYAGGTLSNNVYSWTLEMPPGNNKSPGKGYTRFGDSNSFFYNRIFGDSSILITSPGIYSVCVANAYVTNQKDLDRIFPSEIDLSSIKKEVTSIKQENNYCPVYIPSSKKLKTMEYDDVAEACAAFIVREIDDIMKS